MRLKSGGDPSGRCSRELANRTVAGLGSGELIRQYCVSDLGSTDLLISRVFQLHRWSDRQYFELEPVD